jgi:hypothetical protein
LLLRPLPDSPNFAFLREHEEGLVFLGAQAETLFAVDPVASIVKLRLFAVPTLVIETWDALRVMRQSTTEPASTGRP